MGRVVIYAAREVIHTQKIGGAKPVADLLDDMLRLCCNHGRTAGYPTARRVVLSHYEQINSWLLRLVMPFTTQDYDARHTRISREVPSAAGFGISLVGKKFIARYNALPEAASGCG